MDFLFLISFIMSSISSPSSTSHSSNGRTEPSMWLPKSFEYESHFFTFVQSDAVASGPLNFTVSTSLLTLAIFSYMSAGFCRASWDFDTRDLSSWISSSLNTCL